MKIMYASERPPYPFFLGGAARCAYQIMSKLTVELDIDCRAYGSSEYAIGNWQYPDKKDHASLYIRSARPEDGKIDCGYPVQLLPDFLHSLAQEIDNFKPDILWAQLNGAYEILKLAADKGVQGLYFVHDAEFNNNQLRAIADLGCHMICSSQFLAEKASRAIGRPCQVIYPAANLYFDTCGTYSGAITMINPVNVKGIDTLWKIAKLMPDTQFLIVESWKLDREDVNAIEEKLTELGNVTFSHRVSDVREIYSKSKLLLAPSVWEEGFGMVVIEAQSAGIPVVASARGGLPESVGDGGILVADYLAPQKWVEAINTIVADQHKYKQYSEQACRHAQAYDEKFKNMANEFLSICLSDPPKTPNRIVRLIRKTPGIGRFFRNMQ